MTPFFGGPTHYIGPDPIFGVICRFDKVGFPTEGSQTSGSTQLATT